MKYATDIRGLSLKAKAFLNRFFFAPTSTLPFEVLRIGISLTLLVQLFSTAQVTFDLYGESAFLQRGIQEYFAPPLLEITTLTAFGKSFGVSESFTVFLILTAYGLSLMALLLGIFSRAASLLSWALHLVLFQGHMSSYGVDSFANIFLFYLMLSPTGRRLAWRPIQKTPLLPGTLVLRAAQIHLALSYFASGLEKSSGPQWWNGDAIWRSLMLPVYAQYDMSWMAQLPWLAVMAGWGTLLVEIGYPFFVSMEKTRKLWVAIVLSLHVGIAVFLGLHVFGMFMCVLSLSLFGVSSHPEAQTLKAHFPSWAPQFRKLAKV